MTKESRKTVELSRIASFRAPNTDKGLPSIILILYDTFNVFNARKRKETTSCQVLRIKLKQDMKRVYAEIFKCTRKVGVGGGKDIEVCLINNLNLDCTSGVVCSSFKRLDCIHEVELVSNQVLDLQFAAGQQGDCARVGVVISEQTANINFPHGKIVDWQCLVVLADTDKAASACIASGHDSSAEGRFDASAFQGAFDAVTGESTDITGDINIR